MTTEAQIPEGFRRSNRWSVALRTWALTSLVVGAVGTLGVIFIEWAFCGHLLHRIWQIGLAVSGVAAVANLPLASRVVRDYPAPRYWK